MSCFALIASFVVLAGLLVACLLVFAIGKYNHLVTLRNRISTEMLQLDLALRKHSAELQALGGCLPTDCISRLARAEEISHRAVSGRLTGENLAMLGEASELTLSCWDATGRNDVNHLETTAETWERITNLAEDYRRILQGFPYFAVALACGFDSLSPGNSLPGKSH